MKSKIAATKARNERELKAFLRRRERDGEVGGPMVFSLAWWNALERLRTRGEIRWDRRRHGYVVR